MGVNHARQADPLVGRCPGYVFANPGLKLGDWSAREAWSVKRHVVLVLLVNSTSRPIVLGSSFDWGGILCEFAIFRIDGCARRYGISGDTRIGVESHQRIGKN